MFSHSVEYAIQAMSHLASLHGASATSQAIANVTGVPQSYLLKIMRSLGRAELVKSIRGPHGGFALARDPRFITLLDIVNAVSPLRRPAHAAAHTFATPPDDHLQQSLDQALRIVEQQLLLTTLGSVNSRRHSRNSNANSSGL